MSISVSISRRADPLDEEGPEISADEWLAAVSAAPDFREPDGAEAESVGPHARTWIGHPAAPMIFDWVDGQVEVKAPDSATIVRMQALARALDASVFSDTGEVFDAHGESAGFLDGYP